MRKTAFNSTVLRMQSTATKSWRRNKLGVVHLRSQIPPRTAFRPLILMNVFIYVINHHWHLVHARHCSKCFTNTESYFIFTLQMTEYYFIPTLQIRRLKQKVVQQPAQVSTAGTSLTVWLQSQCSESLCFVSKNLHKVQALTQNLFSGLSPYMAPASKAFIQFL